MSVLQRWNPQWWAQHSMSIARQLARLTPETAPGADYSLMHQAACYQAGFYDAWERSRKTNGQTVARDIEKSLRWDLITRDNSGKGYQAIRDYLESNPRSPGAFGDDLRASRSGAIPTAQQQE